MYARKKGQKIASRELRLKLGVKPKTVKNASDAYDMTGWDLQS